MVGIQKGKPCPENYSLYKKVKLSHYRPGEAFGVPGD
jgi:hypothetical protein